MKWLVYINDYYTRKSITTYNIFDHYRLKEDCDEIWDKFKFDKDMFEEQIKRKLAYYFGSKCEWEIILSGWPPSKNFKEKKIDVYDQVMLNWDTFINYVWNQYVLMCTSQDGQVTMI